MAKRKFKNGMVVWARVPDRNGIVKQEPRPLLITSIHPTDKRAPFVAHCISTRPASDDPDDPVIEMPWDAETGAETGLYAKCSLVLGWSVFLEQKHVEDVSGEVSEQFLEEILQAIRRYRDSRM